eukprot:894189-Pelagomonas_calceolata.AAC.1
MRWRKVGHVSLVSSGSQVGSQAMRTSDGCTVEYWNLEDAGLASELLIWPDRDYGISFWQVGIT